jgi:hypothetical protein
MLESYKIWCNIYQPQHTRSLYKDNIC